MWLSWLEYQPVNQKFVGLILSQAHAWVVGSVPSWSADERQLINVSHIDVPLPLSLPSPLSKINEHVSE